VTTAELVKPVLRGNLVLVGEYRGSQAEMAGYVDKKSGQAISYVRGIHLAECDWYGHVDRVLLFEYFPETVGSVEEAEATFTYERGRKYVFYLEWFKRERGQLTGRLAEWDPEPLEIAEEAVGSPGRRASALLTLFNWKQFHNTYDQKQSRLPFCVADARKTATFFVDFYF